MSRPITTSKDGGHNRTADGLAHRLDLTAPAWRWRNVNVRTMGDRDVVSSLDDVNGGVDEATLRATFELAVERLRDAVTRVKEPVPARLPIPPAPPSVGRSLRNRWACLGPPHSGHAGVSHEATTSRWWGASR